MSSIPLIRASQVEPFAAALRATGSRAEPVLDAVGISPDRLHADPNALIPEYAVWAFTRESALQVGSQAFGFDVGLGTAVERIGAFGRAICAAGTLRDALRLFVAAVSQHSSHSKFSVVPGSDRFWFCRHGIDGIDVGSWQVEQYVLGLMIRVVRLALDANWRPEAVLLKRPSLRRTSLPRLLRDTRVSLACGVTAIAIPVTALGARLRGSADSVQPLEPIDMDFAASLRVALEPMLGSGALTLEKAALLANSSPRTIQRRLAQEGHTFASILDDVRQDTALRLLRDPAMRLRDIAVRLGYSDAANFTRAFRRWTGVAPSQARRRVH